MREPLGVGVGLGGELDVGRGVDGLGLDVLEELLGDELDDEPDELVPLAR